MGERSEHHEKAPAPHERLRRTIFARARRAHGEPPKAGNGSEGSLRPRKRTGEGGSRAAGGGGEPPEVHTFDVQLMDIKKERAYIVCHLPTLYVLNGFASDVLPLSMRARKIIRSPAYPVFVRFFMI